MNKIFLILLTLSLLMLILNHAEDKSMSERTQAYEDQRKILFEELSGKAKYGDGKYVDPSTLSPLPAPTGNARDYPGDLPVLGPPSGIPSWCPPGVKKGSLPPDNERTECVY